ncbi:putative integral membrane protein [Limihaloglobus sulfuriphilus]|uniref:Putative integral membrane protein n=1 Tax=Limihaloglobus sulfuriphilus TaxID=1851148 RepID=A0A1Q2MFR1_9BACT|nr:LapA family protein [Limihaloglobus sulfuriphilus]AQQ71545.1 putative integral membrane protein [Limihaloglobus sulfuriphilus]
MKNINIKAVVLAVIAILAIIIIFQNRASVETKILFVSFQMPRFILLVLTFLLGFTAGVIALMKVNRGRSKSIEDKKDK